MAPVLNKIRTYLRVHEYKYSWTIDDFSEMPDTLRGPTFMPVPGCSKRYCLELQYGKLIAQCFLGVVLLDLDLDDKSLNISTSTSFRNVDNNILLEQENRRQKPFLNSLTLLFSFYTPALDKFGLSNKLNLLENKLVVKGTLTFTGHDVTTSISSLTITTDLEAREELSKDLKAMYLSGSSSDITFSVCDKTLRTHKNIICSRSPVFATMFNNDMLERNTNNVIIENTNFHVFDCFLMFLYTGTVEDIQEETVLALYCLAHKYEVDSLRKTCSGLLGNSLEISSVCRILQISDLYGDNNLKDLACGFIREHLTQVVTSTEWSEIVATKSHLAKEVLAPLITETNPK